ncbi:MAG TPA: TIGR03084 family metal-binding protein [Mycobacteriales bacterium]|nr:TIGR03084 family metal-binding protein [Mycobacteriales bacterium]
MADRPSLTDILTDLRAEHDDLRRLVDGVDLGLATPAEGWDVRETVCHLAAFDQEGTKAATTPQLFIAGLDEVLANPDGFMDVLQGRFRDLSRPLLLDEWRAGFEAMVQAFADLEPGTKVPWYGPPMSPASFATARLMEYWAHGQDVADAAGVHRAPTDRLRHVCHLGVRTRGFSYAVRGRTVPDAEVLVELEAPGGGRWSFGDPSASDRVTGTAEDFCLLVTQRRHRSDTALVAVGPAADEWLDLAQCFAGPPGAGRAPLVQR